MANKQRKAREAAKVLPAQNKGSIPSDVLGSYTGNPADGEYQVPEQDADDL